MTNEQMLELIDKSYVEYCKLIDIDAEESWDLASHAFGWQSGFDAGLEEGMKRANEARAGTVLHTNKGFIDLVQGEPKND